MVDDPLWTDPTALREEPRAAADPATALRRLRRRLWVERVVFAALILFLGWPALSGFMGTGSWTIEVLGRPAATLANRDEAERAVLLLQERAGLPQEAFETKVRLTPGSLAELLPDAHAAAEVALPLVAQSLERGVIYVDGFPAVALPTERDANAALVEVRARQAEPIAELIAEPTFREAVAVRVEPAPEDLWAASFMEAADVLLGGQTNGDGETYTVEQGDVGGVIAQRHGLTLRELEALNPGVRWTRLQVGQDLRVGGAAPPPAVTVVARGLVKEIVPVPYQTIRRADPSIRRDWISTRQEGVPGKDECVFEVEFVNGEPVGERLLVNRTRIQEPQARIVHVGSGRG